MALFSVILPVFNREKLVAKAIESVLCQTEQDFELIVVDDGSTDGTKDVITRYSDNRIKYFFQENHGVSWARNSGVAYSSGRYIAYLDSDDLWKSNKLEEFLRIIEICSPDVIFSDFDRYHAGEKLTKPANSSFFSDAHEIGKKVAPGVYAFDKCGAQDLVLGGYPIYPSSLVVKRDVHNQVRWDPGVMRSEDFNLVIRLVNDFSFCYLDKVLTTIVEHDENKSSAVDWKSAVHLASILMYSSLYSNDFCGKKDVSILVADERMKQIKRCFSDGDPKILIKKVAGLAFTSGFYKKIRRKIFST